jgi:uncharacterized protein YbjQ (UPF0145 family)
MASVQQPEAPSTSMSLVDLARLLGTMGSLESARGSSAATARDMAGNLRDRTNATNSGADTYAQLVAALQAQAIPDAAGDEASLINRTNQIASALNATTDRASAIASSQAGAGLLKRGMANSSQASDMVGGLTRQFGDVYQKIQEMARQRAFDEMKQKAAANTANLQVATQGLVNMDNQALTNARQLQQQSAKTASDTTSEYGKQFTNILGNKLMDWGSKKADGFLNDALGQTDANGKKLGGFDALLSALQSGLGVGQEKWSADQSWMDNSSAPQASHAPKSDFDLTPQSNNQAGGSSITDWLSSSKPDISYPAYEAPEEQYSGGSDSDGWEFDWSA